MALEAVVFPQLDLLATTYPFNKDLYRSFGVDHFDDFSSSRGELIQQHLEGCGIGANTHSPEDLSGDTFQAAESPSPPPPAAVTRRKRRRTRICKNKEEVENQRMTHIAVERNRRKLMNEYLSVLRSLMPPSYAQRGDQASIIGGAIDYVKELEQLLQSQEVHKRSNQKPDKVSSSLPFEDFFTFPQYSAQSGTSSSAESPESAAENGGTGAVADVEVTMVESHANVKIRSKRRPRQLLKIVAGFESLRLSTLHLNVTTTASAATGSAIAAEDQMALYSLSVKIEEGCQLTTVDDIAAAANQVLKRINDEAALMTPSFH